MKVYINKYRNHWLSPYTILEAVCFWEKDKHAFYNHDENPNNPYTKWVKRLDPFCATLHKVLDVIHPKIDYVKIDRWDTWSMDHTLAFIILPMLKQLKADKHGAPFVDDEDVPEHLRCGEYRGHHPPIVHAGYGADQRRGHRGHHLLEADGTCWHVPA